MANHQTGEAMPNNTAESVAEKFARFAEDAVSISTIAEALKLACRGIADDDERLALTSLAHLVAKAIGEMASDLNERAQDA